MELDDAKVLASKEVLKVSLPLTRPTGKIRIKERSFFGDYGLPVAGRTNKLGLSNYVEWQIGYDLLANAENRSKTSLNDLTFTNYKNERKYAYELSEILYYSINCGLMDIKQARTAYSKIQNMPESCTLEKREDMAICRTNPLPTNVNGMNFFRMTVKYPILVHKFGQYDIYAEVTIKEKQRAVGIQPMLYVCLPITTLRFNTDVVGRTLGPKETADWIIGKEEASLSLELFTIFGMLTAKHRFDVLAIFKMLFPNIEE